MEVEEGNGAQKEILLGHGSLAFVGNFCSRMKKRSDALAGAMMEQQPCLGKES